MSDDNVNDRVDITDEKTMARLLELAGPRADIPQSIEARVYNRVHQAWKECPPAPRTERVYARVRREWKASERRYSIRRWALPLALAASVAIAISVIMQPMQTTSVLAPAATVVKSDAGGGRLPAAGSEFFAGDRITTGSGQGLSLALTGAESLRLDADTVLVVETTNRFRLVRGRIYADTGDLVYRARPLMIDTPFGVVTDIGTQFAVASTAERLEVGVREGRIDLDHTVGNHTAIAGEVLRIGQAGEAEYSTVGATDEYWDWATALAPNFDIESKSLLEFLRWAARETGRELVFADQDLRLDAMRTDLHGSVAGFAPLEALNSVMATTTFSYRIEADRIVIER